MEESSIMSESTAGSAIEYVKNPDSVFAEMYFLL